MPTLKCECGTRTGMGGFPNPNVHWLVSEERYDALEIIDRVNVARLLVASPQVVCCSTCGRIMIQRDGASEFESFVSEDQRTPESVKRTALPTNEHREMIRARTALLAPRARMLFSLACAERLSACCWSYEQTSHAPMGVFYRWLHSLFQSAMQVEVPPEVLCIAKQELESIVPVSDDASSPLTVQAQSAVLCLLDAIDSGVRNDACVASSDNIIDAIDNYVASVSHELTGQFDDVPETYPLLEREKARQAYDVDFLARPENLGSVSLVAWRMENRQFVVPVALKYSANANG